LIATAIARSAIAYIAQRGPESMVVFKNKPFWERIKNEVVAQLQILARGMGESLSTVVSTHFLFTTIGALVTPWETYFFSIGDGVFFINGQMLQMGPYPGNEPPYIGYNLLSAAETKLDLSLCQFQLVQILSTIELESLLIGCDGVLELLQLADHRIPGKQQLVGHISQFWTEDKYFENPNALLLMLRGLNKEELRIKTVEVPRSAVEHVLVLPQDGNPQVRIQIYDGKDVALIKDDCTMIVGRRNPVTV